MSLERVEHGFICQVCLGQRLVMTAPGLVRLRLEPVCCGEPMRLALKRRVWREGWGEVRLVTEYGQEG